MKRLIADLHMHTVYSDGVHEIEEVIGPSAAKKLKENLKENSENKELLELLEKEYNIDNIIYFSGCICV